MNYFKSFGIEVGQGKYYEEAVYGIGLVYNLLNNKISGYLKTFNLTPAKLNTLMIIKHHGGKQGISQVDISKRLIVTPSNMTRLLDKLEKEDLVCRIAQEGDRRVNIVKISKRGAKLLDKLWPGYVNTVQSLVDGLDLGEQKTIATLLTKWLESLM